MLAVGVVRSFEDVEPLIPAWEALLDDAEHAEPVGTPQWFRAWWSVFGTPRRALRLVTVHDGKELVALAPFARRTFWYRRGIPFRRLELLPSGETEAEEICSDYIGVLVRRGRGAEVASALAAALRDGALGTWDEIVMPALNGEDPFVELLARALRETGSPVAVTQYGACPYIRLPATWEAYLDTLPKKHRYAARRTVQDFKAWVGARPWSMRRAETAADLAHATQILTKLHSERWQGGGAFGNPRYARFHGQVMANLAANRGGSLDLLWLEVDGRPIASAYNIVYRKKSYFYQSGRALDVPSPVRAGGVMQLLAIQRAIEQGHREYDFLNGESVYKQKLALERRPLLELRAVAPSSRARALEGARTVTERVACALRRPAERAPDDGLE
jgi:hypothetical protein